MNTLLCTLLGTCLGSYLGCLADRWGQEKSVFDRSLCDHCQCRLPIFCLIPLVSWIGQKGKSQCCGHPLSVRYSLEELIGACAVGFNHFIYQQAFDQNVIPYLCVQSCTLAGAWIGFVDWRYHHLPLSGLFILFISTLGYGIFYSFPSGFVSFATTFLILGMVNGITFILKRHILPLGDWMLILLLSSWLPLNLIPWFLTSIGAVGIGTALGSKFFGKSCPFFPFAPSIIFSWWIMMLSCSLS